jgi:hypothetical protein
LGKKLSPRAVSQRAAFDGAYFCSAKRFAPVIIDEFLPAAISYLLI